MEKPLDLFKLDGLSIFKNRKKNNNIPLYNAFNKYGIENFLFEIIETNIPNEQIDIKEKYYINFYSSKVNQNGYNVADGGNGGKTCSKLS